MPSSPSFPSSQSSVSTAATTPEPSSTSSRVKKIIDLSLDSDDDVRTEENDSDDEVIFLSENSVSAPDRKDEIEDAAVAAVEGAQAELEAMYAVEAGDADAGEHADTFARLEAEGLSKKEEKKYQEGEKAFKVRLASLAHQSIVSPTSASALNFKDFVETPRPWLATHPDLNILDEDTWSGCAMLYPTGPHVGVLRAEPIFKHMHITGTIQQAVSYPHEPERKHIGTLRVATRADLNIAVSVPASPFVWISSPKQWNLREGYGNRQSVFMKLNKNVAGWNLFGEYQMVWAGYLKDSENRQLSFGSSWLAEALNQAELDECRWKRGDPGAVEPIKPEESDDEKPNQARERSIRRSKAPSVEGGAKPKIRAKAEPKREDEATPQSSLRRSTRRSRAPSVETDDKPDVKPKRRRVGAK
ncbi:hypothetical protein JCM10296v2_002464 [Rhodotorula toruloides]